MNDKASLMRKVALALIVCAVVGTEISYHFTLETRFEAIEEKLQQNGVAMQEMQQSLDAMAASKTETVSGLNKQLALLQASFDPLGRDSKDQADALTQLRQQLATLQQAQTGQQDAQRKLSDYISQLEANVKKARDEAAAAAKPLSAPAPVTTSSTPVAVPIPAPTATLSAPAAQPARAPAVPNASVSDLMSSPGAVSFGGQLPIEAPRAQAVDSTDLIPTAPKASTAVVLRAPDLAAASDHARPTHSRAVGAMLPIKH